MVDAGDFAGLEAIYRKLQDRHFSDSDFSEHIHSAFDIFSGNYESGAVSKRWLEAAPKSPFAMTARADFYRDMGWAARGGAYAPETPPEQMARMQDYHAKAKALYEQALAIEPKLMPAHCGPGRPGQQRRFHAGLRSRLRHRPGLQGTDDHAHGGAAPRWGGSYPRMLALEKQMLPYYERRPLLALSRVWPYQDMHDVAYRAKEFETSVAVLKPMIAVSSSPQVYEDLAAGMSHLKDANAWERLAYAVQVTRFARVTPGTRASAPACS
jgi:hypothetical protein